MVVLAEMFLREERDDEKVLKNSKIGQTNDQRIDDFCMSDLSDMSISPFHVFYRW